MFTAGDEEKEHVIAWASRLFRVEKSYGVRNHMEARKECLVV